MLKNILVLRVLGLKYVCEKKILPCLPHLQYYYRIFFIDAFIISTGQCIYIYIFFNTNTGLMIKKINKKYLLTSINDKKSSIKSIHWPVLMIKKVNKKYTLTCINDKKDQ